MIDSLIIILSMQAPVHVDSSASWTGSDRVSEVTKMEIVEPIWTRPEEKVVTPSVWGDR